LPFFVGVLPCNRFLTPYGMDTDQNAFDLECVKPLRDEDTLISFARQFFLPKYQSNLGRKCTYHVDRMSAIACRSEKGFGSSRRKRCGKVSSNVIPFLRTKNCRNQFSCARDHSMASPIVSQLGGAADIVITRISKILPYAVEPSARVCQHIQNILKAAPSPFFCAMPKRKEKTRFSGFTSWLHR